MDVFLRDLAIRAAAAALSRCMGDRPLTVIASEAKQSSLRWRLDCFVAPLLAMTGKNMRLGLFMMPVHPPGRVLAETLAEDEEKAIYADRLGFDELWLGEHFSATTEPIPSPLMFMAGLVPRTKNIIFGT